jgi:hypothetical protein
MHPALNLLTERLSCVHEQVERLFEQDEPFRDLCEEYLVCSTTLARIRRAGRTGDALEMEYVALLLRLEGELLRYLDEHSKQGG